MLNNTSVKRKLYAGFGLVMAIAVGLLGFAYVNAQRLVAASDLDRHTLEVLVEVNRITNAVLQIQTSTRGFMLTGEESLVDPINEEEKNLATLIGHVRRLTTDNPAQQQRLTQLEPLAIGWVKDVINPLIIKRREMNKKLGVSQQVASRDDVVNGAATVAAIRGLINDMNGEENRLLGQRSAARAEAQLAQQTLLGAGLILMLLAGVGMAMLLGRAVVMPVDALLHAVHRIGGGDAGARATVLANDELGQVATEFNRMAQSLQDTAAREKAASDSLRSAVERLQAVVARAARGDLTGRIDISGEDVIGRLGEGIDAMVRNLRQLIHEVQQAGIQVTTSATEIAAAAKQQEATGMEQAQTTVEVLSTTREISANTSELLKAMEQATGVADYTTRATAEAQANLGRMDLGMQNMVSATDAISGKLAALSEKAANINSVLVTITKVADQTNILSLNAAIEAEKAGDAGRGFAVVATEIRRLADQTAVSTWDIEQMLKEMQSAVSASVMGMDKFADDIRRNVGEMRQVASQLSGVIDQVQKLPSQFDLVLQGMQSQAVGAQQITETMTQLNDATQQTVESLKATSEAVRQLQFAANGLQTSVTHFATT
ncbi:methyl-accepting chemotaxis protein [Massilia sp. TS11]|uniref:methyl-accepting chemotaxis protein n=1 Tax=Massilia sp. TS11 TaxID=2908003 RepID=UPI001EDA8CE6|nr:methyl-accepting chemotaxis protein [Massilia sp. TS11]MCG2586184.1 methyl-accepting chemotaxis protein [Massilia sp. TS11]